MGILKKVAHKNLVQYFISWMKLVNYLDCKIYFIVCIFYIYIPNTLKIAYFLPYMLRKLTSTYLFILFLWKISPSSFGEVIFL